MMEYANNGGMGDPRQKGDAAQSVEPIVPVPDMIYDFGMNNGDDVAYYLTKAARVIAVEANALLCDQAAERFSTEIGEGRLKILNVALADRASEEPLPFYIHRLDHVLSQMVVPAPEESELYTQINVTRRTASSIVREFGPAKYIKIDLEHCDQMILRELFAAGIYPDHISAECHTVEVFCLLGAAGYNAFNLVDGRTVQKVYDFPFHSAGPFGQDLKTPWRDLNSFFFMLAQTGMGWRDVHASRVIEPEVVSLPKPRMGFTDHLADILPSLTRAVRNRFSTD